MLIRNHPTGATFASPTSPRDLCTLFRVLAGRVWNDSAVAIAFGSFEIKEETFTDMLLLALAKAAPGQGLHFEAHSRSREGRVSTNNPYPSGADFELTLLGADGFFQSFRVQAKRQYASGEYRDLDLTAKQVSFLRNNSGYAYPIYLFYNIRDPGNYPIYNSKNSTRKFNGLSYWGCSYSPAPIVWMGRNRPTPSDFLPNRMRPWHSLVCYDDFTLSLPRRANNAVKNLIEAADLPDIEPPRLLHYKEVDTWFNVADDRDARAQEYMIEHELSRVILVSQMSCDFE